MTEKRAGFVATAAIITRMIILTLSSASLGLVRERTLWFPFCLAVMNGRINCRNAIAWKTSRRSTRRVLSENRRQAETQKSEEF